MNEAEISNRVRAFRKVTEKIFLALDDYSSQYGNSISPAKYEIFKQIFLQKKDAPENKYTEIIKNNIKEMIDEFIKAVNESIDYKVISMKFQNVIDLFDQINEFKILYHPYPNLENIIKCFNSFLAIIKPVEPSVFKINQSKLIAEEISLQSQIKKAQERTKEDTEIITGKLIPVYQNELNEMSGLLYNIHTHKDEIKAEAKLLRTVTDLTYTIDQINHRDLWAGSTDANEDYDDYDDD